MSACDIGTKDITLPHLLSEYGYEHEHKPPVQQMHLHKTIHPDNGSERQQNLDAAKKKKKVTIKEKRKHKKEEKWVDERELEKLKQQNEQNLEVYFNTYNTRDEYVEMYMDALREKIDKQKADIDLSSQYMEHIVQYRKEMQARKARKLIKKRMVKQMLTDDDQFIRNLPKSRYYSIVGLLDKMKRSGAITTQTQEDQFWRDIEGQSSLTYRESSAKSEVSQTAGSDSHTNTTATGGALSVTQDPRVLTQISETVETSRPTTRQTTAGWQPPSIKAGANQKLDANQISRLQAQALDRQFPQVERPNLACYTLELKQPPRPSEEVDAEMSAKRRDKERKFKVRKLRQMYNSSQANKAQNKRLMLRHPDEDTYIPPTIDDLTGFIDLDGMLSDSSETSDDHQAVDLYRHRRSIMPIMEVQEYTSTERSDGVTDNRTSYTSDTPELPPISDTPVKREMPDYLPLSMSMQTEPIKEAKCLSTYWKNYTYKV